ncbi:MAG TPA: UDP-N-acetylglucosamine 2-epimerase (non-hydrolyzing) [Candidatus Cloacimonadota bacterium]|nr:UDP-N-acetylglucosamine 2-epimerase (non-hydrolyzing) [Candidatus Cloacimonadota bacterium]
MKTSPEVGEATSPRHHDTTTPRLLHIVGARPQFVKLAALHRSLSAKAVQMIIHTGQHYDASMSDSFFADMEIPAPNYNLEVGSGSQGFQTARMLEGIENLCLKEKPDLLIIYGDTNSTLAGALVGAKLGIKTAHVEACLRSFNRAMPEEINRIVADHTSDILLCPTQTAMDNAAAEGLSSKAFLVGDIMTDTVAFGLEKAHRKSNILNTLSLPQHFYLLTLHRPYNVDDPVSLKRILDGLDSLGTPVIFPVHPRPRQVISTRLNSTWQNIKLIEPQSYLDFIMLHANCEAMITDSGGVQKEAYLLSKPCITLRTETEWVETVQAGWNLLLPPESADFPAAILDFQPPKAHPELYGTQVAKRMGEILLSGDVVS